MLNSSQTLVDLLKQSDALTAKARVIAEWNHNRYSPIQTVDNYGHAEADYGYDLDLYPIESITEPLRPTAGILKGRAGEGAVTKRYDDNPATYRTYTADVDSKYKYWTSPTQSTSAPYTGGGYALTNCQPYVLYSAPIQVNKVYICFESSWASPVRYDIQITTDGTYWDTIAQHIAPNSQGQVAVYLQDNGQWTTDVNYNNPTQIRGLRLRINSLSRISAHLNLVELSARLERDVTDTLISYEIEDTISEPDLITPMGTISSNGGSVTLSNLDNLYNNDNPNSLYYGLIDANVKFTVDLGIAAPGGAPEYIRLATMYSDAWQVDEEKAEVPIKDASKYLQEMIPQMMLLTNVTIGEAVWRMLDSLGFNSYAYVKGLSSATHIPFFWTDGEKTAWDAIQELCKTTQSTVYFDESGVLQIKTRDAAFNKTNPIAWTLDYAQNGTKKPDIITLEEGSTLEANKVQITYKKTNLAEDDDGNSIMEVVWQPEDTVALRASGLRADMSASQMDMSIDAYDSTTWPYEAMVNVRGELIRYAGKGYRYHPYDDPNITTFRVINDDDEKRMVDNDLSHPNQRWRNYFTGYLKIVERGYDDTEGIAHDTTIAPWLNTGAFYGHHGGTQIQWNGGLTQLRTQSILRMSTNGNFGSNMWYNAHRTFSSGAMNYFGTRLKFPSSPKGEEQSAGIFFWGSDSDRANMYTVDVTSTARMDVLGRRAGGNEVRIFRRKNGNVTQVGGKGFAMPIADNQWVDIDVAIFNHSISVSVNGRVVLSATDSGDIVDASPRCGLYVRGYTVADFEYFYAADGQAPFNADADIDNSSFLDLVRGGFYSNQYYKDALYGMRKFKKRRGKKTTTVKQAWGRLFDEFGVVVHEVRPFDVKFEKFPVVFSDLYFSNESQAVVDEYTSSPFGAKFLMGNAARENAVVNGSDSLTFGIDNTVDQKMLILGRTIQQGEDKTYEVKNDQAIRARGEIPLQISSDWIQSEGAAKALGDWIVDNWSEPADSVTVEMFANPLIQIGDVVAVNYPPKNMSANTHKYFVVGVTSDWSDGPGTTLELRRARI